MKSPKIYSAGSNFSGFGGAQKVLIDIHNGIKNVYPESKILGFQQFSDVNSKYNVKAKEYEQIGNPFKLKNATIIIHARKLATYFTLLDKLFFLNLRLIYVSHNMYEEKRAVTFLPKRIVSISDRVTGNLTTYFRVPIENIIKIHNGIIDTAPLRFNKPNTGLIKILYPARLTPVKRQVDLVRFLKGKLPDHVRILFAGVGPDLNALNEEIGDAINFECLGFVDDMDSMLYNCDYVMLFSLKEGLPISLMEGAMYSKPLIVNDVGGNLEIAVNNENGFVANNFSELQAVLNKLPANESGSYKAMASASRRRYEQYFRYEMMIDKYIHLLNQTLR